MLAWWQVLESKMMEIEHDIAALHEHEKMSRNAVADGEAVLHAEGAESPARAKAGFIGVSNRDWSAE